MFKASTILFIYTETPLHVGSGRGLGTVDLPIQRERLTNYPMIQASSLKGNLRAAFLEKKYQNKEDAPEFLAIFGQAENGQEGSHAGALSVGDARLLLFPVRSLAGVFAWTTSLPVLQRFKRDMEWARAPLDWNIPTEGPPDGDIWTAGDTLKAGSQVVLEEFSFNPKPNEVVESIATWLANNALPALNYDYWKEQLRQKLCILPDNAFRDFTQFATEVQTHIKINQETKTVEGGALWTVESLPVDTLLYAPLMATPSRSQNGPKLSESEILQKLQELDLLRTQLGGDETTGQGMVALQLYGGAQ